MVSKKNRVQRMEQAAERQSHFGIRKLTVGAASVLLGTSLWLGNGNDIVKADTKADNGDADKAQASEKATVETKKIDKVVVEASNNTSKTTDSTSSAEAEQGNDESNSASDVASNDAASTTAKSNAQTHIEKATENTKNKKAEVNSQADEKATADKIDSAAQEGKNSAKVDDTASKFDAAALKGIKKSSESDLQTQLDKANEKVTKKADIDKTENTTTLNTVALSELGKANETLQSQLGANLVSEGGKKASEAENSSKEKSELSTAELTELAKANATLEDQLGASFVDLDNSVDTTDLAKTVDTASKTASTVKKNDDEVDPSTFDTVTNFSGIQAAASSGAKGVNVKGDITGDSSLNLSGDFTINGLDGATLNLGTNTINLASKSNVTIANVTINSDNAGGAFVSNDDDNVITFENVTNNKNSLFNGKGHVHIKGTVNTTVGDDSQSGSAALQGFANATKTTSGTGAGEPINLNKNSKESLQTANSIIINGWKSRKVPNIYASNLDIDDNATLNVTRTATGDGIVLKDGAVTDGGVHAITQTTDFGKLYVGNNATLNINLKNSNMTGDQIKNAKNNLDIHNAAVRVNTSGSFTSGNNAHITMNVGSGRGIVLSGRAVNNDVKSSSNYISRGDGAGSGLDGRGTTAETDWLNNNPGIKNTFKLGDNNTFNFVGRDAFMLGNRATFNSGKGSTVNVHTYGNGNAIDMGGFSTLTIDPSSTVSFISDGKQGNGNYDQNNYVALGGGGAIDILKDATFRVILTNRGNASLNDDINIASYDPNLEVRIYVGNNATFDVQADNTQGNGELIAVPLPASKSVKFILDNVKYVNLQKTAKTGSTILAPAMTSNMVKGFTSRGIPTSKAGYGNLIFLNAGKGQNASFEAYGDLAAFKWNNENLSSNGLEYDPNETVSANYDKFENSANQTWSNMYGFTIPYAGFSKSSGSAGDVWVDPNGTTAGTNVNSEKGVAFSDLVNGFSPYMSQRLVVIGHSMQPVTNQRTVHYVVQDVDKNGNPLETDPTQMREIASAYIQSAQGDNSQSQELYKDNATDQLIKVERNEDGTPKLDSNGAVIPVRDDNGNYVTDGDSVNWKSNDDSTSVTDGYTHFNGYTVPTGITGTDSNGNVVQSLDGKYYKLATDAELATITTNSDQVVKGGKVADSKNFANTTNDFKSGNFYNTYKDGNLYVVYRASETQPASAKLNFVDDDDNGKVLNTTTNTGDPDTEITFPEASTDLQKLTNDNYVYVSTDGDGLPSTTDDLSKIKFPEFDNQDGDQVFTVHLKHKVVPVTPTTPDTDVPNGTPEEAQPKNLTKTVDVTVNYVNDDGTNFTGTTPANAKQTLAFTGTAYVDATNGKLVNAKSDNNGGYIIDNDNTATPEVKWTPETQSSTKVVSPTETGYHVKSVSSHADGNDVEAITDITKDTPAINVTVTYTKDTPTTPDKTPATGKVTYIDDTTKKTLTSDELSGNVGDKVDYTTKDKIQNYEDEGYELVSNNFTDGDETFKDSGNDFEVHLKHGSQPVNPDNPGKPNDPINPNDPQGPKYPEGTDDKSLTKNVTRTIVYKGAGDKTPATATQTVKFTQSGVLDKVTGEWTTPLTWSEDQTFEAKTSPEVDGYHVASVDKDTTDNVNVDAATVNHEANDYTVTVTYEPDAPTTPDKKPATGKVTYIDDTTKKTLTSDELSGNVGDKIDYTTQDKIQNYENEGYELVSNDFTDGDETFKESGNDFEVHLKHGTAPVGPNNPHDPDTPVNPDDPRDPDDQPKWPAKDTYTKQYTSTLHYQYADGTTAAEDKTQTSTWTRTLTIDKVTGEVQNPNEAWTSDIDTYKDEQVPVIKGYVARKQTKNGKAVSSTVAGDKAVQENLEDTVIYDKIGNIVPQDPDGNPIPDPSDPSSNVPNQPYTNDPTDPTKVTPNEPVPDIPGYNPDKPSVTPEDPTKDTPVVYTKDDTKVTGTQTVHYVDSEGNTLLPDEVNDSFEFVKDGTTDKWNEDSHKYADATAPVITGYVTKNKTVSGQTATPTDPDKEITITYEKIGKIVPVDKETGDPIPDAPTPSYTNDPSDPTKVEPNEPVPNVPNYRPEDPTPIIPEDPTKDTEVPYVKDSTPEVKEQKATVVYRDADDNNKELTNSGDLTGNPGDKIDYSTADTIKSLEDKGYVLKNNGFDPSGQVQYFDSNDDADQIFYVDLVHGTTPVTPDEPGKPGEPINPNDPDGPKYPQGTDETSLTKDVTRTIKYQDAEGNQLADPVEQNVHFTASGVLDKVTGEWKTPLTWSEDQSVDKVTSPSITDYHVSEVSRDKDGNDVASTTLSHTDDSYDVIVTYAKNGTDLKNAQNIPSSQTVKFVDEDGNELAAANKQTAEFNYSGDTVDSTTGNTISVGTWNEDTHTYDTVAVPVIDGYVATRGYTKDANGNYVAGGLTATHANPNVATEVVYTKIGNIVPQDPNGNPIPDPSDPSNNVPNQPYTNDPSDPTKVTPNEPVPTIPGYTPNTPSVTPEDPSKDTPVVYTPDDKQATGKVDYIDDTTGQTLKTDNLSGKVGDKIDYTTAGQIAQYQLQGYELVSNDFADGDETFKESGNDFAVHLKHGSQPVNPDEPGKPGEPINPNDPDGPKYPDNTGETSLTKDVTRTINYVDSDGNVVSAPIEQTVHFTASGVLDKVTGEWTTPLTWSDDQTVAAQNTPVIPNYHVVNVDKDSADNVNVDSATVSHDSDNYDVTVTYAANGHIVPVDPDGNEIPGQDHPQFPTDPSDPSKVDNGEVPNVPGYDPENGKPGDPVNPDPSDPSKDVTVPYVKNPDAKTATGNVTYYDDTTGQTLKTDGLKGNVGEAITYTTADQVAQYENQGYELVSNDFKDGNEVFQEDGNNFAVHLKHATTPVNPENPGKPGEPINPNDPDGPKWPDGTDSDSLTKQGKQTVHYEGAGDKTPQDNVQNTTFTHEIVVDKVTGKVVQDNGWTPESHTFDNVDTPAVEGYHADKKTAGGKTVTVDNPEVTETVTYTENGHIVPVDPNGNKIPNAGTPTYPTDPSDPTKVTSDEPVPDVPGYTPSVPTVTPEDPGKDTEVVYNTPDTDKGQVTVTVHDNTDNKDLPEYGYSSGEQNVGTEVDFDKTDVITKLTNKGYKIVNPDVEVPTEVVKGDSNVVIYVEHATTPVNPENPGKPGEPINPNDPEGPKYPTESGDVTKDVTRTITFIDNNGKEVSTPVTQTVHFTASGILDKVTGEWTTPLTWSPDQEVSSQNVPYVDNYHVVSIDRDADGNTSVKGVTLTHVDSDYTVKVTYEPNGHIVPVDPDGNKIPNVDNPTYPTDPSDPSSVTPNEPVPNVPGYTPSQNTVTPNDPGKDTEVVYTKIDNTQHAVVIYQDVNDGTPVQITTSGDLTGDSGTVINYSTADTIKSLEDKGYVLAKDGFVPGTKYDDNKNSNQTYYVTFTHGTTPVNPDNPGKPGEPINPNDPNGPKYPDGTDVVSKDVTRTINYVDNNGKQVGKPITQTAHFTASGVIDKVTGKWVTPLTWTGDGKLDGAKTPVIEGYHVTSVSHDSKDNVNVDPTEVTSTTDNYSVDVVYTPNGKIVPVDPDGNKIPNADTPQYKTDPDDPSKVVPDEAVPTVDGYTPSVDTVTPKDPGKDTEVIYTQPIPEPTPTPQPTVTTVTGKQTITFVDGDNNNAPLRDADVQTHDFTITNGVPSENSYTFGTVNVPVIDGYVATVTTAGGKTVTPDNPDANVTVVYHKIGKIVPVDKDHNPIPSVDTPSYKNDPNDPTKVVPDEAVPTVDGYTPSQETVTPVDPTKDTEVVYTKNEEPEPDDDTPDEPDEPETPSTPSKSTNKPKPSTPRKTNWSTNNAPHSQNWDNNVAPHSQNSDWSNSVMPHSQSESETIDANGNIVKNGEVVGYVDKNGKKHYTLPQTGENNNEDTTAAILGAAAASLGMIGLAGVKKRRKRN